MPATSYKIWAWGGATGDGTNEQYNVGVCAKAKRNPGSPYEIANEILCLRLGQAIGLPVPDAVILDREGHPYFGSLHPAVSGEALPPITNDDINHIVTNHQNLACGIVVFDSWILNEDRHEGNILFDEDNASIFLIDHGRAFYDGGGWGAARLVAHQNHVCCTWQNSCIAQEIRTLVPFDNWLDRIRQVPRFFIREALVEAANYGLPTADINQCLDFLCDRRDRLKDIFRDGRDVLGGFPSLEDGMFDPLAIVPPPPEPEYFI